MASAPPTTSGRPEASRQPPSKDPGPSGTANGADKPTDWALLKRVWPFVRKDRRWFWLVLTMTPLGVLMGVLQPVILREGIDGSIATGDLSGLALISLALVGTVVGGWLFRSLGFYALQYLSLRGLARLRSATFNHVMGQGARFFDTKTTGSLMTRTINDVDAVYESLARGAIMLLTDLLTIVGMLTAMLLMDWRLTLVTFAFSPLIWAVVNVFRRRLRPLSLTIRKTLSQLNGYFAEQIYGISLTQLYGADDKAKARFDETSHRYMRAYHASNWLDASLYAIMDGMASLAIGAVVWFTAVQLDGPDTGLTLGLLVAFIEYIGRVFVPIREFTGRVASIQRAVAALERIFGLLDTSDRVPSGKTPLPSIEGHIAFNDVSFAYNEGRPDVLRGVSLKVAPGEVVAIVGATGSGKTTIGKVLTRMYGGYRGSITLDGHELTSLRTDDVRRHITVVHQDVVLFDGDAAFNIGLDVPEVDMDTITEAARLSRAAQVIASWPDGYQSKISERGGNLSSGERVRKRFSAERAARVPEEHHQLRASQGQIEQALSRLAGQLTHWVVINKIRQLN